MANLIFGIFITSIAIQLLIYSLVFSRLAFATAGAQRSNKSDDLPFVSVVVCARNEAPNLTKNLPAILAQEYPRFELIVVDDGSADGTKEILDELAMNSSKLHVIRIENKPYPGKKYPLSIGIEKAKGEHLLLTDADCKPDSARWIKEIISCYTPTTEIVLGFGGYVKKKGLLNKVVRYETFHTFLQYGSWALVGLPYMGVGRNLSYLKKKYAEEGGFSRHENYLSGDDDLFVNGAATSTNTALCTASDSFTWSAAPASWAAWYTQKKRHLSASSGYRKSHRILLGLYAISHVLCYVTIPFLFFTDFPVYWYVMPLALRWLVQMAVFYPVLKRIQSLDLWYFSTIFDFFAICYYATFVGSAFPNKNPIWR